MAEKIPIDSAELAHRTWKRPLPQTDEERASHEAEAAIQKRKETGAWYDYRKPRTFLEDRQREQRRVYILVFTGLFIFLALLVLSFLR